MLLSEVERETRSNHLVHQLFSVKRCFGGHSSIGVVVGPGCETDRCSTIAELVRLGHVPTGFEWLDPFLAGVPKVTEVPCAVGVNIISQKYDSGPPCPWDVARAEQEKAKARVLHRRLGRRASLSCDCLLEKGMPYNYQEQKKEWLFTDNGQRQFLAVRDRVKVLLESAGAFMMARVLDMRIDDWNLMTCVDRLVELDEIKEVTRPDCVSQHRIFTAIGT